MNLAAVDIGTNSMRLLVAGADGAELGRWQRVTGLGRGLTASGMLQPDAVARTVAALAEFGATMRELDVGRARAVATSACRKAANRDEFLDAAEKALGVRPEVISGVEEAGLSFVGATSDAPGTAPRVVIDIGGGSTELVWEDDGSPVAASVDVGSVWITERILTERPATFDDIVTASHHCQGLLERVRLPAEPGTVIGVAGTWTSLAAIALDLPRYDRALVHHSELGRHTLDQLVERLAGLTLEETAAIPALDPGRAPVILGGAVIARECTRRLAVSAVLVSEQDLLDGVLAGLLAR